VQQQLRDDLVGAPPRESALHLDTVKPFGRFGWKICVQPRQKKPSSYCFALCAILFVKRAPPQSVTSEVNTWGDNSRSARGAKCR
jgi:hypothetical protein